MGLGLGAGLVGPVLGEGKEGLVLGGWECDGLSQSQATVAAGADAAAAAVESSRMRRKASCF